MPNSKRAPLRLAFVGLGAIASRVAQLLVERHSNVELIGVGTRTEPVGEATLAGNVRWLQKPEALANLEADMVIEAAGRAAVEPWGLAALRHAGCLVVSSTSAFCEEGLLERLIACAEQHRSQILVPPGALERFPKRLNRGFP
jgi:aspartate dehydrogenase